MTDDPTEHSLWRPLRVLLDAMDADIGAVYAQARIEGLKPTWVPELLRLNARGPMTIAELARSVGRTHSALSQKVAAMRAAGWVRVTAGADARSKRVALTRKAERVTGKLAAEWRATEASVAEIEAEIPYPLTRVVTDIEAALGRRSFRDRIAEKLAADPDWNKQLRNAVPGSVLGVPRRGGVAVEEWAEGPILHEAPAKAEGRRHRSLALVRTGAFRRAALLVLVAVAAVVSVVAARHTLARSMHVLGAASPWWLLLALAAEAASLTAFGLSRRRLLRANGHRVSLRSVLAITYASNALSLSVPFAGAELAVVYSYRQFRRIGLDAATTSWSLTVSWICSTSALALLLAVGAVASGVSAAAAAGFAGAAVYLVPAAGALLALRFDRARAVVRAVLARLAAVSRRLLGKPEKGAAGVDQFLDEVSSTRLPLPGYASVFGLAVANWAFDCAALALAIRAVGMPVPWDDLLLVYGAGAAVSSSGLTPGGFFVVELAMTAALTASGLDKPSALAAVLAYRVISFWLVLLGGWILIAFLAHPRRSKMSW